MTKKAGICSCYWVLKLERLRNKNDKIEIIEKNYLLIIEGLI